MSLTELQKLPVHNGIIDFKITKPHFKLNVLNDDSSIVKYFGRTYDLLCLDLGMNYH